MVLKRDLTRFRICCLAIILFAIFALVSNSVAADKKPINWIEKVTISKTSIILAAKIDTGARHSSLNAPDLELSTKGGETWVKFTVVTSDNKSVVFEEPVVRMAKIKRKGTQPQTRPVIHLKLCVGDVEKKVEVNLVNRKNFNYQMLVGRSFLQDSFVVDVSKKNTMAPQCAGTAR